MGELTQFAAPGKPHINWLYIGGGIFGTILLIYLLSKNKSNTGTVAAGTSINAALGSIQEQALNIQGAQSVAQGSLSALQTTQNQGFQGVGQQFSSLQDIINAQFNQTNDIITAGNSGITDLINKDASGINQSLAAILGQEGNTYSTLLQTRAEMEAAFGANSSQLSNIDTQLASVFNEMQSGFTELANELNKPVAVQAPPTSGGNSGPVHTYTVYLPGGGAIHTNSTSAAAALNNVPGGHF